MKKIILFMILVLAICASCVNLDQQPKAQASSTNWYSDEAQIQSAVNYLYDHQYWHDNILGYSGYWNDALTDDWTNRYAVNDITGGTLNSQTAWITQVWQILYRGIANANVVLEHLEENTFLDEIKLAQYKALTLLARAYMYSKLIFYYGDVPFFTTQMSMEDAYALGRTSKETILKQIYEDYDYAIANLPDQWTSGITYPNKGAAYGFKARTALWMNDWSTVVTAAKGCMDTGQYELEPNFIDVFTKTTKESLFSLPYSIASTIYPDWPKCQQHATRTIGGTDFVQPSWDLFCSFLCSDGLPIDESPLYDPQNPFKNRDPRCAYTIVEFGTPHLGVIYQPHPDSLTVLNINTGERVKNMDSKGNIQWASFNGLMWNKQIQDDWADFYVEQDYVVLRYADVLLMYAEAKIELNQIDQSVVDVINRVRARAYGVDYTQTDSYPAVALGSQSEMRKIVRLERRMELANEGRRYKDIIRWGIAEKVLNRPIYGLLDLDPLREKIVNQGLWFFPDVPPIDEDGCADFTDMYNRGLIKLLANRHFESKQYLWPIPASEILICPNLEQNPNY
ncbi:MAG: RagB/SusD family nutrient uptake outer membrane protein [Bacteroidales bacterium]|nr:RagB/SusD family nutrient uptake outer membrane protein [Bacteroidales bacterium]